ncbi:priA protein precursor [Pseudohyphozyma bogoriensis]|nr:priA protein precursor [Pseudohyphozyma bogoriensis]
MHFTKLAVLVASASVARANLLGNIVGAVGNTVNQTVTAVATDVNSITSKLGLAQVNSDLLKNGNALINLNVIADVLSTANCSASAGTSSVVGVQTSLNVLNAVSLCACINVLGTTQKGLSTCPDCPAHASSICSNGLCGCQCNPGYYATTVNGASVCAENSQCASPNIITFLGNGQSICNCARGFIDDLLGGCINACLVV